MLHVGSRYPAEVKRGAGIYTPILHGCGEPLDGVTLRFCVHRRSVVDAALEQIWYNHAEDQQSRRERSVLHAYIALSDCAEASTVFCHRGCPVAAVMGTDAAIQVKVDLIRGPFARKSTPCRICPTATKKWEWYSSNAC